METPKDLAKKLSTHVSHVSPVGRKEKGRSFEDVVCKELKEVFPEFTFSPTPYSGVFKDLQGDVYSDPHWWPITIECKKIEGWNLLNLFKNPNTGFFANCFREAVRECVSMTIPWLVFSRNWDKAYACVPASCVESAWGENPKFSAEVLFRVSPSGDPEQQVSLKIVLLSEVLEFLRRIHDRVFNLDEPTTKLFFREVVQKGETYTSNRCLSGKLSMSQAIGLNWFFHYEELSSKVVFDKRTFETRVVVEGKRSSERAAYFLMLSSSTNVSSPIRRPRS